jgi:glycosyltransferase involved in cell wall biosynthesis
MKINYYFRKPLATNFSIENVFDSVKANLPPEITHTSFTAAETFDISYLITLRALEADVHHITGAVNYAALSLPARRTVLTVHDIGHLTETLKGIRRILYKLLFWSLPLQKVKYLTTISDFTQREVKKHFNVNGKKIKTIYNPVSTDFTFRSRKEHECPVILQVGGGANKNIESLVEAVTDMSCKLLLVRPPNKELISLLKKKKINYEFRSELSKEQLVACYSECDLLFFASSYEGFGLPIIEAMASGRPVITSSIDPMQEVAGDCAFTVDWKSASEIRNAIRQLWENKAMYLEFQTKGLDRARQFDPKRIAGEYLDFYYDVLANA